MRPALPSFTWCDVCNFFLFDHRLFLLLSLWFDDDIQTHGGFKLNNRNWSVQVLKGTSHNVSKHNGLGHCAKYLVYMNQKQTHNCLSRHNIWKLKWDLQWEWLLYKEAGRRNNRKDKAEGWHQQPRWHSLIPQEQARAWAVPGSLIARRHRILWKPSPYYAVI